MAAPTGAGSFESLRRYPLLDALRKRRSRRFGVGMRLPGGPLAYASRRPPGRLTVEEEAALAFAGCGVTGYALAELPYEAGDQFEAGSGNILTHFVGRTVASGDAMHVVALFVLNDEGAWMLRRPQDFPREELPSLIEDARRGRLVELYERGRIPVADRRPEVPREVPVTATFNKWAQNLPGTTYFLPVSELSAFAINVLLTAFGEEWGLFVVDDRRGFRPAGLGAFARSRGGHLHDDPRSGRVVSVSVFEDWFLEFAAIEQGGVLQNLGLTAQALGLGGFPHFAAHPFAWFQALGFRMVELSFSRTVGLGPARRLLVRLLGKEVPVPTAVGLEVGERPILRPYAPPYYRTMEEAVLAFVDSKYAEGRGTLRDGGAATAWRDGASVQRGIPSYSDKAVAATIAYCEEIHRRYGRFPATSGPFRTVLAYQAHRLDPDFYEKFYRPDATA